MLVTSIECSAWKESEQLNKPHRVSVKKRKSKNHCQTSSKELLGCCCGTFISSLKSKKVRIYSFNIVQ